MPLIPFDNYFVNVILPLPLQNLFTYSITEAEANFLKRGMRVAVPFGKKKIYTALVYEIHQNIPDTYETKPIHQILEDKPSVNEIQLKYWKWVSEYYICSLGDVYKAALPLALLLESETVIFKNPNFVDPDVLTDEEFLIFEALQHQTQLSVLEISKILYKKTILSILKTMLAKKAILLKEKIYEKYKPKLVKYVCLNKIYKQEKVLNEMLDNIRKARKQYQALMTYFSLETSTKKHIRAKTLQETANVSASIIKSLVDKGILEFYEIRTDRVSFPKAKTSLKQLNEFQEKALKEINIYFKTKEVTLLYGVANSGKTEIYTKLIKEQIDKRRQVLFLLPEIALTTQLTNRLKEYFGSKISVFHSRYSINERVEVWNNVLYSKSNAQVVLGEKSSLFLPFSNLGLIIVDEEHDSYYKRTESLPLFNARDTAILLARYHKAKTILGSATPSLESFFNATNGKYGLVNLTKRYGGTQLPIIELVDIKEKYRKKKMKGHFSDVLIEQIKNALKNKEQVILFQNRRGFSPVIECETCASVPQCTNCDISLTFHKNKRELCCHYCNYRCAMPLRCSACSSQKLKTIGFGTEQIETELNELFPNANVGRMDLDTTRGKYGYQRIIGSFQAQEIDILVGTKMLFKGLHFSNVTLVGVMNADSILNFPDFRAHERTYQILSQVAGRAGRAKKTGKVLIQTFNPRNSILRQVATNNYEEMYKEQLRERLRFCYPPHYRMIQITLKHKKLIRTEEASDWFGKYLRNYFYENVLGPSTPSISRVRNLYIKHIIVKIPAKQSLVETKKRIEKIKNTFQVVKNFRSVRLKIDVDPY